ncbi:unnamed protein product [Cylindrotheca closterium]|uniref:Uncharacterized protein n=1 Tax=Cylindrotheca closterium TaxID=2856 RepID=A0AAD2G0M6_9STRA|nr:unnamed protein product [Cylindrotheca closterium]
MLLKVDSYHDQTASLVTTLYPCLATSKKDGILVSAGRKEGDLTFLQDKTVSRQHFVLRCLGTAKGMTKPRTKEEKDACKESELDMCIVYENNGKAGSFVCSASPEAIADKKEDYDDDSETDDEGVSQQPSADTKPNTMATSNTGGGDLPAISATARNHFGNIPVTLKRLDVGDKVVLPLEASTDPILIQLGRFESTVKVSWIPLRVMFSNMKQNKFERTILPKLATIGGMRVEDTANPTHLVTEELNAGGKQIIAWAQELPMVRSTWLDKMLERKSPLDTLPDPKDYPIQDNSDNSITFWKRKPNRELLKDCTLLSVEPGSFETMAVAAGANLVALHELAAEEKQLELAKETQEKDTIVFIAKTRKRVTKKLAALGIPQVDLKRLAKSVTSRTDLPQDINGKALSRLTAKDGEPKGSGSTSTATTSGRSTRRTRRTATQETPKPVGEEDDDNDNDEEETPPSTTPYETQCLLEPQLMEVEEKNINEKNTESEGDKLERIPEQETEPSTLTEPSGSMQEEVDSPPKPAKAKKTKTLNATDDKCRLEKADSRGWFSAAPQDDKLREEWRKTYEKRHWDNDNLDFDIRVETESMQVVIPEKTNDSNWRIPPGRKRKGVKDFRKFRKNRIIKSDPRITIRFKTVGTQRNDDQSKTFDEQEQGLAEEQRIADALFGNDGPGGGRKRRRRVV